MEKNQTSPFPNYEQKPIRKSRNHQKKGELIDVFQFLPEFVYSKQILKKNEKQKETRSMPDIKLA